jgi:hypothetical protein
MRAAQVQILNKNFERKTATILQQQQQQQQQQSSNA